MTLKFSLLALALLVAWFVLFRPRREAPRKPPAPPPTELARCPRCGVYHLPDDKCACDPSSTAAE